MYAWSDTLWCHVRLLKFLRRETRDTLGHVFPSLLGIRLSRRMNEDVFHDIIKKVEVAQDIDEARRTAAVAGLVDQLKANFNKQYDAQFEYDRDPLPRLTPPGRARNVAAPKSLDCQPQTKPTSLTPCSGAPRLVP